jgi:hypothetical protein
MRNRAFWTSVNLHLFIFLVLLSAQEAAAQGGPIVVTRQITVEDKQSFGRTASMPTAADINKSKRVVSESKSVTVTLPEQATRINPSAIQLKAEFVTFQSNDKISALLEASGIKPDVNALSLVYDLNPTIDNLKSITPNFPILLPRIEGDIYTQMAMTKGYRVSVAPELSAIHLVKVKEAEIKKVSGDIASLDPKRFPHPNDKAAISKILERTQNALRILGSNQFALSQKVLRQSAVEAEGIRAAVAEAIASKEPVGGSLVIAIETNTAALEAKTDDLSAGGSAQIRVEVQTRKKKGGKPVNDLRVFYAPELDLSAVDKYRDPTTPTTEALPIGGRFTFWAGEGDDSTHPRSDTVTITVHSKNNDPVKLQVD